MAEQKLEDLKKLSPKERIKRIKELQEKNKQEIADAQKLLNKAEEEAEIEDELKDVPVPQLKAENIDELFSPEEKELFKAKRYTSEKEKPQEELEQIAEQAPEIKKEQEQQHIQYIQNLAERPAEQLANEVDKIYQNVVDKGYASKEDMQRMGDLASADREKFDQARSGEYKNITDQVADTMIITMKKAQRVQNIYQN